MEREKHLKKTYFYFLLSMVLAASLVGCGPSRKVRINGNYDEWIDAIGINKYPNTYCSGYLEYENGVRLVISDFGSDTADEFKKIISNHNAFVTRNPDYFPEGFDIDLIFKCCGGDSKLRFSNYGRFSNYDVDISSIETEKSHRMRYVYLYDLYDDRVHTKFEAETIVGSLRQYMVCQNGKAFNVSEHFENFDKMVVDISPSAEK
ncbi:MAG: hypothetical protein NC393_06325, partial [Clostridium sp.]|nr:hypothetical protein [Clostridium sp.]MCM1171728.1 hypothetical protein [Clostridium sp.]